MFDILLNQLEGLMSTFTNERGFFGIFGILLFAVVMIAELQMPTVFRKSRRTWLVLAIAEPLLVLALGSLIVTIFSALNYSVGHEVTGPVYSVPLI